MVHCGRDAPGLLGIVVVRFGAVGELRGEGLSLLGVLCKGAGQLQFVGTGKRLSALGIAVLGVLECFDELFGD